MFEAKLIVLIDNKIIDSAILLGEGKAMPVHMYSTGLQSEWVIITKIYIFP